MGKFLSEGFLIVPHCGCWQLRTVNELDCGLALAWSDGHLFQDLAGIGVKPHLLTGSGQAYEHLHRINLAGRANGGRKPNIFARSWP